MNPETTVRLQSLAVAVLVLVGYYVGGFEDAAVFALMVIAAQTTIMAARR